MNFFHGDLILADPKTFEHFPDLFGESRYHVTRFISHLPAEIFLAGDFFPMFKEEKDAIVLGDSEDQPYDGLFLQGMDAREELYIPHITATKGQRELTGAVDLINYFKLIPHHEFFCKRSLHLSVLDTHYLHNVVGETEIRKGEGMELDELVNDTSYRKETNASLQPFDLDTLRGAFQLKETTPVDLPSSEKGILTIAKKSKSESKDKEKKHKKHKDKDKDKDKKYKKHKHHHKDKERSMDKDKERKKDRSEHYKFGADPSKKHHDKKRKHNGNEDLDCQTQEIIKLKDQQYGCDEVVGPVLVLRRCVFSVDSVECQTGFVPFGYIDV